MKKMLIAIVMITSLFQLSLAIDNQKNQRLSQPLFKHLRKIEALKTAQKIPRLTIKSIINKTQYQLAIVDKVTYNQYILAPEQECEIASFMDDIQNKISREDRLQGICDQHSFFITKVEESGYLSIDNGGLCTINLIIQPDHENTDLPSIHKMVVKLWMSYFQEQDGYGFSNIEIENCKSEELEITMEIFERKHPDPNHIFQANFCCSIKLPKNIPHHYFVEGSNI